MTQGENVKKEGLNEDCVELYLVSHLTLYN